MSVVGSVEQIGEWKELEKGQMEWSEGDFWTVTINLPRVFQYKYVVQQDSQVIRWEKGPNRIYDFCLHPEQP